MSETPLPGWYQDPIDPSLLRWWDGQAWSEQTSASPYLNEKNLNPNPSQPLALNKVKWLAITGLVLSALASLLVIAADLNYLHLVDRLRAQDMPSYSEAEQAGHWLVSATVIELSLLALTGLFFIIWMYRTYKNLYRVGTAGLRYTPKWAVWGWLIPFANLVIPLQIINDLWRSSEPGTELKNNKWRDNVANGLILLWWLLWIGVGFASQVVGSMFLEANTPGISLQQALMQERSALQVDIVIAVVYTIAACLAIAIISRISSRQTELLSETTPQEDAPLAPPN